MVLTPKLVSEIAEQVIYQKFERRSSNDFDRYLLYLSGDQVNLMELSYTKQQQKQKQQQHNKNQDSDTMEIFAKEQQISLSNTTEDYYAFVNTKEPDLYKSLFNMPLNKPIFRLHYTLDGKKQVIHIHPTFQFLYSNYISPEYIDKQVKININQFSD